MRSSLGVRLKPSGTVVSAEQLDEPRSSAPRVGTSGTCSSGRRGSFFQRPAMAVGGRAFCSESRGLGEVLLELERCGCAISSAVLGD
jgi:hypothetical protein